MFTRITHLGCNLLGLANAFGCIGAFMFSVTVIEPISHTLGLVFFALAVFACIAADLVCRIRSDPERRVIRLFLPTTGGCLVFIPVWIIYPLMAIGGTIAVFLQQH